MILNGVVLLIVPSFRRCLRKKDHLNFLQVLNKELHEVHGGVLGEEPLPLQEKCS